MLISWYVARGAAVRARAVRPELARRGHTVVLLGSGADLDVDLPSDDHPDPEDPTANDAPALGAPATPGAARTDGGAGAVDP